jgi:hypothetical protein
MDSRRLVVWIAAGILGFQGGTMVLDRLNCSVLSWLYVRRHGLELSAPVPATAQGPPGGVPEALARSGGGVGVGGSPSAQAYGAKGSRQMPANSVSAAVVTSRTAQLVTPSGARTTTTQPPSDPIPFEPTGVFCDRPRSRIDAAVSQGLSILAGLALGGSGVGGGKGDQP